MQGSLQAGVLMEHPPKQGLKHHKPEINGKNLYRFNGTSIKTRIKTEDG